MESETIVSKSSSNSPQSFFKKYWLLLLAIFYIIWPIDLIPDAIPFVGGIDDASIVLLHIIKSYREGKK